MKLATRVDRWPVVRPFKIAYHTFHHRDPLIARGEAGGHPHLEPIEDARARIEALRAPIEAGLTRADALALMPAGPARAALDAALWDLEAKRQRRRVWQLAGLPAPRSLVTAYTVGLATPADMAQEAVEKRAFHVIKIKVDGEGGVERLRAIAAARPDAEFIVDANEGFSFTDLQRFLAVAPDLRVRLIEQPLPRDADAALATLRSPIPIAADEAFHDASDLERLAGRYTVVNVKLDKIGGLTAALAIAEEARARGLGLMVGCNGGTSLGLAPAYCFGLLCEHIDLDSPLLLARDVEHPLEYRNGSVAAPTTALWG
jgi:L-alanine-DL-glutamate epimerase-like enolase superfamily enzyme